MQSMTDQESKTGQTVAEKTSPSPTPLADPVTGGEEISEQNNAKGEIVSSEPVENTQETLPVPVEESEIEMELP